MSNKQKTAVDGLWDYLKGWIPQGQYAGVREVYLEAKEIEKEQAQLYATFVMTCVNNNLPPITFNDWINLDNK